VADELVPEGMAGEWTHALMDIGALFCRPRSPRCGTCPLLAECRYAPVATATPPPRRRPGTPFRSTSRWLRGRLLDRARATPDGGWFNADDALGQHTAEAAADAARTLATEGLLELHPTEAGLARLPQ
jgi:A/G-specific adenine glycosylase